MNDSEVNSQRGFSPMVVLIGVLIIALGAGAFYYFQTNKQAQPEISTNQPSISHTQSSPTDNLQTYTATTFSFKYPADWVVSAGDFLILLPKSRNEEVQSVPSKMEPEAYPREKYSPITIGQGDFIPTSDDVKKVETNNIQVGGIQATQYITKYTKASSDYSAGHEIITVALTHSGNNYRLILNNPNYKDIFNQILSTFKFN